MNFGQAISSGFSNYVGFSGRAARSEYWYWILFYILGAIVAEIIDSVLGLTAIYPLFALAVLLPSLAVSFRRLHDLDRSAWWILLAFIPIVGVIILIIWYCSRGTVGPNRFGPDPLAAVDGWARSPA
jgi:uncharacterized membrane protein YhaH (DUF805 family)